MPRLVLLDRGAVRKALGHAKAWVQGPSAISEGVEKETEADSLERFLSGEAAFFRSWQNTYGKLLGHDNWGYVGNGCAKNEKCFGVSPLPRGNGDNNASLNATVIGGWQLAVPKNSRHKLETLEFIRYATNEEVQAWRAHKGGYIPTITKINDDNRVREGMPFLQGPKFKSIKEFTRPFNKAEYEGLSTCFSSAVHSALFDKSDKTGNAVEAAIEKMQDCGIIQK